LNQEFDRYGLIYCIEEKSLNKLFKKTSIALCLTDYSKVSFLIHPILKLSYMPRDSPSRHRSNGFPRSAPYHRVLPNNSVSPPNHESVAITNRSLHRRPACGDLSTSAVITNGENAPSLPDHRIPRTRRNRPRVILSPEEDKIVACASLACEKISVFKTPLVEHSDEATQRLSEAWKQCSELAGSPDTPFPPLNSPVLRELSKVMNNARGHLVAAAKDYIDQLYRNKPREDVIKEVQEALEDDRYICHPDTARQGGRRFLNPAIPTIMFNRYFKGPKQRGNVDPTFIDNINKVFVCLTATCLQHALEPWATGVYVPPKQFCEKTCLIIYLRHKKTWDNLPDEMQEEILSFYREEIEIERTRGGNAPIKERAEGYEENDVDEAMDFMANRRHERDVELEAIQRQRRRFQVRPLRIATVRERSVDGLLDENGEENRQAHSENGHEAEAHSPPSGPAEHEQFSQVENENNVNEGSDDADPQNEDEDLQNSPPPLRKGPKKSSRGRSKRLTRRRP
jgi:hypothetical protein